MTRILAPLALWLHQTSPGLNLVKRELLLRQLAQIYSRQGYPDPEQAANRLLAGIRDQTGLLLERGEGEYSFIHLTLQEYLAAVAIGRQEQHNLDAVVETLAAHVEEDRWHELILLTIGYIGLIQGREETAGALVTQLARRSPAAALLAGEAAADIWPGGIDPAAGAKIKAVLTTMMTADRRLKPNMRVAAGDIVARLGDSRPGVGLDPEGLLPDLEFCFVPAGSFWMGRDANLHQNSRLNYDYWLSRYPLTVAQFQGFVATGGYQNPAYWPEAGQAGVWLPPGQVKGSLDETPRIEPYDFGPPFNLPNHPVVGLTWYEALAYCRWLQQQLAASTQRLKSSDGSLPLAQVLTHKNYCLTLPSEAEWEKAARGGSRWLYPWGDDPDLNRANFRRPPSDSDPGEPALDSTSPVGCFPGGKSLLGCEEMAGNIWEWTRSLWGQLKEDPKFELPLRQAEPDFDYPYDPADGREALNAGVEMLRVVRGGAFNHPDLTAPCTDRAKFSPYRRYRHLGFRLALTRLG
jgi:formylglycine-generating enzyme required for sulfatase activity